MRQIKIGWFREKHNLTFLKEDEQRIYRDQVYLFKKNYNIYPFAHINFSEHSMSISNKVQYQKDQ